MNRPLSKNNSFFSYDKLEPRNLLAAIEAAPTVDSPFSGVVSLSPIGNPNNVRCVGALISDRHVLASDHCDEPNFNGLDRSDIQVNFHLGDGSGGINTTSIVTEPEFPSAPIGVGTFRAFTGLTIFELTEDAPAEAQRYRLAQDTIGFGNLPVIHAEYGVSAANHNVRSLGANLITTLRAVNIHESSNPQFLFLDQDAVGESGADRAEAVEDIQFGDLTLSESVGSLGHPGGPLFLFQDSGVEGELESADELVLFGVFNHSSQELLSSYVGTQVGPYLKGIQAATIELGTVERYGDNNRSYRVAFSTLDSIDTTQLTTRDFSISRFPDAQSADDSTGAQVYSVLKTLGDGQYELDLGELAPTGEHIVVSYADQEVSFDLDQETSTATDTDIDFSDARINGIAPGGTIEVSQAVPLEFSGNILSELTLEYFEATIAPNPVTRPWLFPLNNLIHRRIELSQIDGENRFFPAGNYEIRLLGRDVSGEERSATWQLNLLPDPPPETIEFTSVTNVPNGGQRSRLISWVGSSFAFSYDINIRNSRGAVIRTAQTVQPNFIFNPSDQDLAFGTTFLVEVSYRNFFAGVSTKSERLELVFDREGIEPEVFTASFDYNPQLQTVFISTSHNGSFVTDRSQYVLRRNGVQIHIFESRFSNSNLSRPTDLLLRLRHKPDEFYLGFLTDLPGSYSLSGPAFQVGYGTIEVSTEWVRESREESELTGVHQVQTEIDSNLVSNGDFENFDTSRELPLRTNFPGWYQASATTFEYQGRGRIVRLDSNTEGTITQQIYPTPGEKQLITFDFKAGLFDGVKGTDPFQVLWNGNVIGTYSGTGFWQTAAIRVDVNQASRVELKFREISRGVSGPTMGIGPMLDNIRVVPVTDSSLLNGSFEDSPVGRQFGSVGSWTSRGQYEIKNEGANHFRKFLALDNSAQDINSIFQDVPTVPGATYFVSFDTKSTRDPFFQGLGSNEEYRVRWNNRWATSVLSHLNWRRIGFYATADSDLTRLMFTETTAGDGNGAYIDNVTIARVEPLNAGQGTAAAFSITSPFESRTLDSEFKFPTLESTLPSRQIAALSGSQDRIVPSTAFAYDDLFVEDRDLEMFADDLRTQQKESAFKDFIEL
jgi:hypothetical protein